MKLQIKTIGGSVLFESEAVSLRELVTGAVKQGANLSRANLSGADLSGADLSRADLSRADLSRADLSRANLSGADLSGADLSRANLSGADLSGADLSGVDLSRANLSRANLSGADLSGANLSRANLSRANLSGATGLPDMCDWFRKHFKRASRGVIVYKTFGSEYMPNPAWKIERGSVISENCDPSVTDDCGCGVNVGTLAWVRRNYGNNGATIWRCLIPWAWLPGVVIPLNTNGKIRCSKLILLREVHPNEQR